MRDVTKKMDVIGLNIQLENCKIIALANFAQKFLDIALYAKELHRVFGILGLPHKMETVLTN